MLAEIDERLPVLDLLLHLDGPLRHNHDIPYEHVDGPLIEHELLTGETHP